MQLKRGPDGTATLLADDGRELLDLARVDAADDEFDALLERLAAAFNRAGLPRVAVGYKEGLLGGVHADIPCEVVLIEDDPFDDPPLSLRRRRVDEGDPAAVSLVLATAEQRTARRRG